METLEKKAAEMLQKSEVVVLTSINQEGYPRPVPMSNIKSEGATTVWLATGKDSLKTKEFAANPKAGLCFQEEGNSVVLTGKVEIKARQQEMWQEWFSAHFSKGPTDPNYVLLKFKGHHATIWIDGHFVRRNL